jgi:hypothetical protein
MKINKKQYLMVGLIVAAIAIIYVLASLVVPRVLVTLTKASPAYKVSVSNSRIIGEKILAVADGKDKGIVNVFVLDTSDKGVPGRQVALTGMGSIFPTVAITDNEGKASFSMVSAEEKQYEITATVDGIQLPGVVKVTFRNN